MSIRAPSLASQARPTHTPKPRGQQSYGSGFWHTQAALNLKYQAWVVGVLQAPRTVVAAARDWTKVVDVVEFPGAVERSFSVSDDPILGIGIQMKGATERSVDDLIKIGVDIQRPRVDRGARKAGRIRGGADVQGPAAVKWGIGRRADIDA